MPARPKRLSDPAVLLELFVWSNLAFLALDVYLAHRVVSFRHWGTYVPLIFSIAAPVLILIAWMMGGMTAQRGPGKAVAILVGLCSIVIGIMGMVFHLGGFFEDQTLKHLVYAAPFAAPLAYTGIGLLIVMNRMVPHRGVEWAQWVVLMALGGWIGNFVLALADHAQIGFYTGKEWIAVGAAAIGTGFTGLAMRACATRAYLRIVYGVMLLQMGVGTIGFYWHVQADLAGSSENWIDNFIFGAPAFAPLLFANIALLSVLGVYAMMPHANETASSTPAAA